MSVNDQPPSADTSFSQLADHACAADLDRLNRRFKRLSDDVLPLHPYLLTIPTNAPYRLRSANTNWAVGPGRPFSPDEQDLQYMTFLTHHNTDSLLVAVGDWADESGRMMLDQPSALKSSAELPPPRDNSAVKRKKISLNDYKTQKTTGSAVPSSAPTVHDQRSRGHSNLDRREGTVRVPKSDPIKKNNEAPARSDKLESRPSNPSKAPSELSPAKTAKKRPPTSDAEPRAASHANKELNMQASKKPRLSPDKESRKDTLPNKTLPTLLSPTLPPSPAPDPGPAPRLPRLLSPTLPPEIEKELAQLKEHSPGDTSPKRDVPATKTKRDEPNNHTQTPSSLNSSSNSATQSSRASATTKDTDHIASRSSLVVKLRYGRLNRKRVDSLLRLSGKKKASRADSPSVQDTEMEDAPLVERKKDTASGRGGTAAAVAAPVDRAKLKIKHEKDDTASTPSATNACFKEPKPSTEKSHLSIPEKPKVTSTTPGKDAKASSAGRRNELLDVAEGKTPVTQASRRPSADPGIKGSPAQPDRSRNHERREQERRGWQEDFKTFTKMGRELKHAADRFNNGPSATDEKLAVVTAIEAVMCFVLAFVADDQGKALFRQSGDSSTWRSIIPYWRVVYKNSASFSVLQSLCQLLGAVSYDTIHALDLERLAVTPLPGEHDPVPTPGSDGNTVLGDDCASKKSSKEFAELKVRLPEYYRESHKLWLDASRGLSEDVLSRDFPTTWARRSHRHAERGRTSFKAGSYAGDYFLPFGAATPPIEVVRFGWALLKEWCSREGVEWQGRLKL
ncbi:hypothetical protein PDE_02349 [Penicillium oxalicum 114-2]|uniref:Ell binding protein Ebp1 C-terminal domain-containing protein n=1 Tax=Penicillium oxalicum (strain 114-2 / CGMCC 5302) TaxID=933388 RepID=S7ZFI8_PENO1|nr:hypothetical protein PDE_02349 [Penicillium oxalicum 114-2]